MWTWKQENTEVRGDAFYGLCVGRLVDKVAPYAHLRTRLSVLASPLTDGSGALPIVDDQRRLVGMVSEFDMLASLCGGRKWGELLAHDIMTPNPASITQDTHVSDAM